MLLRSVRSHHSQAGMRVGKPVHARDPPGPCERWQSTNDRDISRLSEIALLLISHGISNFLLNEHGVEFAIRGEERTGTNNNVVSNR